MSKTTNIQTKIKSNAKLTTNIPSHNLIVNPKITVTHLPITFFTDTLSTISKHDESLTTHNTLPSTDTNKNNKLNHALATANLNTPKRKQAIILRLFDGLLLKYYIITIEQIISTINIMFESKISMSRI